MDNLTATKKLFHAIVVIGMAASLGCSSGTTAADASTDGPESDGTVADAGKDTSADVMADVNHMDASDAGDGFSGWMGC
jgi:hypothetical protein